MMTIKHITDNGEEFVYPTTHVNFVPERATLTVGQPSGLWRYDGTGRAYEINHGMVYVMNEAGSTVARYDMTAANNYPVGEEVVAA